MIIHFLINVVDPPVLINLQNTPISEDVPPDQIFDESGEGEHQIWYAKDIENLPKTTNQMHIGQLLHSFFEYYSHRFQWGREVISIRTQGGIFSKQEKGWIAAVTRPGRGGQIQSDLTSTTMSSFASSKFANLYGPKLLAAIIPSVTVIWATKHGRQDIKES
ncbi:hypothetical protein B9Z19DRAFT_462777 [Tuber borchii]|uniref:PAP-associated domain-containing protein n=1 Tax=Tuber borchii TaxID=42251 RepID=A0A2T6ZFM0_TUBBO|nr:hypothetical protein B9Z19DRAFT_462777 [Tuber borchii]